MFSKAQIKRQMKKLSAIYYRRALTNKDFTIISNNCWGGVIYDKYHLPYLSPTIGLWIPPADYIKFIYDLKKYVTVDLERIYVADSRISDMLMERSQKKGIDPQSIIIGKIEDVEIIFQHYKSFEDARDKWYRRRERINWNNIVIKMNDQNGCTRQHYEKFMQANYANKLFITANIDYRNNENTCHSAPKQTKRRAINIKALHIKKCRIV